LIASNAAPQTAYLYCGEQFDSDLGLYYLRARYLNPNTGRFWTMDTYEGDNKDPLSLHKYLYCRGNPVNGIDPSGHQDLIDIMVSCYIQDTLGSMVMSALSSAFQQVGQMIIPHQILDAIENGQAPDCELFGISGEVSIGRGGGVISGSGAFEGLVSMHSLNFAAFFTPGLSLSTGESGPDADVTGYAGFAWNCPSSEDYADGIDMFVTLTGEAIPSKLLTAIANKVTANASSLANVPQIIAGRFPLSSENIAKLNQVKANIINAQLNNIRNWSITVSWSPSGDDFSVAIARSVFDNEGSPHGIGSPFSIGVSSSYQIYPDQNVNFK
jgi:RHS repeat-associated protein